MNPVICVRHRDGWCALEGRLDPDAVNDMTVCGYVVIMRWGNGSRLPDCLECLIRISARHGWKVLRSMKTKDFKIGQELFVVRDRSRGVEKVKSVGRKWVTLTTNERFDPETMWLDGGKYTSPGKVYLSASDHAKAVQLQGFWFKFRNDIAHATRPPEGVTIKDIGDARRILRMLIQEGRNVQ